jgi:RNA polymerase sigma factor (sigma-70 family)
MGNSQLQSVVEHIRNLAAPELANDPADQELLRDFSARRDQAAFTTLVKRHASMVFGICRRVLNHAQDAEDAFQATFLLLARKPTAIRKQTALASWLHGVAYRTALRAKRDSARRRFHEKRVAPMARTPAASELALRELQALLDQEIERLAEKYKAPFVLCCLQGKSKAEAAIELGWRVGTVSSRLAYARKFLQTRLARRGVSLSAALGAVALAPDAASAVVPGVLIDSTVKAALQYATGKGALGGVISAEVASLVKGVGNSMAISKFKSAFVLMLGVSIAATGIGTFTHYVLAQPNGVETTEAQPPSADKPTAQPNAQPPAATRTVRVVVLDPNGKPLPGARVQAEIWTEQNHLDRDYETDAAGVVQVELPETYHTVRIYARKKTFATLLANWERKELTNGAKIPAEYTLRMEPAVTVGGRIVDEQGKPIAGARVEVQLENRPKLANSDGRLHYVAWFSRGANAATTDADGRWRLDNVPGHSEAELNLLISHRDYLSDEDWRHIQKAAGITTAILRQEAATLTMKRGVIVGGRVTNPDGKPISGALVLHGEGPFFADPMTDTSTDADGRFQLPALTPGQTTVTVIAPGWAPQLRRLDLQPGLARQEFHMKRGKPMRLRIVDANGKPVPHASVVVVALGGNKLLLNLFVAPQAPDTKIPRHAGPDGTWEWTWAPDEPVKLNADLKGVGDKELEIAGGGPERTVVLKAEHRITGRVTDVATGKPIPRFTLIPVDVFRKDFLGAERNNSVAGKDGRLQYLAERTDIALRLRVEAPGYRTQDGPEFRVGDETSRRQDFRLKPSRPITGLVVDRSGQPAAKVTVLLATPTETVTLERDWGQNHQTKTDAAGRFEFPDPGEPVAVLARADSGFASAEFPADHLDVGTLRLRPWASVRGQFREGGRPVSGASVMLDLIRIDTLDRPSIYGWTQTVTGPDGRFEFPRAVPGPVSVRVSLGPWKDEGFRCGPSMPLDLQPGERAELDLGGTGTTVSGKVTLTGKVPADLDCTYSLNYLVRRSPGIAPPSEIAKLGFDARNGWRDAWQKTREGLAFMHTLQHWFVKLAPDGAFRVSGVPPGDYDLAIEVYAKPSGCLVDPLARKVVRVTVTAEDIARGELALPDIAMAIAPIPGVGDSPELSFQRADGSTGTLAKYRGHYTIVHFWASWCAPCMQQLPALRRLHDRFDGRGVTTLGLSLDEDAAAWRAALKRVDPAWSEGRLAAANQLGISSVPTYWLLDPAGKIVAKVYDPDELTSILTDRLK